MGVYYFALVAWCCFECVLVTAIIYGWAQLLEVLENERYFISYCDNKDSTLYESLYNNETTVNNVRRTCNNQDSILNLVYSLASFSTSISIFLGGKFLDTYGFTKTRVVSCMIYFVAGILVYVSTLGFYELLFPGLILTCTGGSFFMACLVKVCGLIPRRRCTVVSLINAAIDLSATMLLICKLSYRAGFSFKNIVIVYYTFSVIHGVIFTFTLFPKSTKCKKEVITIENKLQEMEDKLKIDNKERDKSSPSNMTSLDDCNHGNIIIHPLQTNDYSTVIENNVDLEKNDSSVSEESKVLETWCEDKATYFPSNEILYSQIDGYSTIIENNIENEKDTKKNNYSCSSSSSEASLSNELPYCQTNEYCDIIKDKRRDTYSFDSGNETSDTILSVSSNEIPYLQINEYYTSIENTENNDLKCSCLSLPEFPNDVSCLESTKNDSIIIDNKTWRENELFGAKASSTEIFGKYIEDKCDKMTTAAMINIRSTEHIEQQNIQKEESFWVIVKTPKYILHTAFTSVAMLRTLTFVGMLNLNLKRLTNDPNEVDFYLTVFATILLIEIVLCFFPGTLLDWNPKDKHSNYSMVLSFYLTNTIAIMLTAGLLIPSLKLQQQKIGWMKQEDKKEYRKGSGYLLFLRKHCLLLWRT